MIEVLIYQFGEAVVFGRLYEGPDADARSKRVFDAVHEAIQDDCDNMASVWRTRNADSEAGPWFIVVCDESGLAHDLDYGDGLPYDLTEGFARTMLERRLAVTRGGEGVGRSEEVVDGKRIGHQLARYDEHTTAARISHHGEVLKDFQREEA